MLYRKTRDGKIPWARDSSKIPWARDSSKIPWARDSPKIPWARVIPGARDCNVILKVPRARDDNAIP